MSADPVVVSISPPIGTAAKRRGRPTSQLRKQLCAAWNISERNLERAIRVLRLGVPELHELIRLGELDLRPAEYIARLPHDDQRWACAQGAGSVRAIATHMRTDHSRRQHDGP
jgi:hypothetical protein